MNKAERFVTRMIAEYSFYSGNQLNLAIYRAVEKKLALKLGQRMPQEYRDAIHKLAPYDFSLTNQT